MDGSFNQAAGQGQSSRKLATPSNPYQANVNRKKTQKWVEAKVQSYDGDDWGTPDSEEEDEPDSPEVPPPVPRPVADHQRLPSETRVPGTGRPGHTAAPSTGSNLSMGAGGQPLSIQQQQQQTAPASSDERPTERTSPAVSGPSTAGDQSSHGAQDKVVSPRLDQPPATTHGAGSADPKRVSVSPQLPNVARMSGFGVDFLSNELEPKDQQLANQPSVQEERESSPEPDVEETKADPRASVASGPMLPATTFTPPTSAKPATEPRHTPETQEPPVQSASQLTPGEQEAETEVSPVSDHDETAPRGLPGSAAANADAQKHLQASEDARSLPPLRTPSPHEPRTVPPPAPEEASAQRSSSGKPAAEITPTEPLQPKKPERSPSDYEPQPLERQLTLDTSTSSPVKESDVLSDEIMKTLTPGGLASPLEKTEENRKSQAPGPSRESSYSLSGYDDYWADTADKQGEEPSKKPTAPSGLSDVPEHPPVPAGASSEDKTTEPTPVSPDSTNSPPLSGGHAGVRRRFSWEAEEEPSKPVPTISPPSTIATSPLAQNPTQLPPATKSEAPQSTTSPGPTSPAIKVVSETGSISHQVSQASSNPAPTGPLSSLEPPSPVSELSDKDATPLAQSRELHFPGVEANSASPSAPSPVSAHQGEPAASSAAPGGEKILTFREIMSIPATTDRIEKYAETRNVFASQESGLDNWITTMRSEYPEHAHASSSFSGQSPAPPPLADAAQGTGQPSTAQQPYYQQYLNASTPASNTGSARSRLAGYQQQAQAAAGSAFGHGGNQIGTKGKEFMQSAGKMGKGLFSKGRSKLRGTDKGDNSPPPLDRKPQKSDRRASWIPSLGPKSRTSTSGAAPQEAAPPTVNTNNLAGPPKLAEPLRVSPILAEQSPSGEGGFWQSQGEPGGEPTHGASATVGTVGNLTAGPGVERNAPHAGGHPEHAQSISNDWVVVPRQSADQRDTVAPAQNAHPAQRAAPTAVHQDSGVAMASQPDSRPEAQRNPSFKGLPPIRRNSSFGLSSIDVMHEAEQRVSADEASAVAPAQNGTGDHHDQDQLNQQDGTLQHAENATNQSLATTLVGQDGTSRTGRSSLSQKEPMRYYQSPAQPPSQQPQYDPSVPSQLQQGNEQPAAGQPGAVSPQPPSGWRLEESHLSEPLHVARRRAGTEGSQHTTAYGLGKETGEPGPTSPTSPGTGPQPAPALVGALPTGPMPGPYPPRGRTSDVPPSSARRYPDLFKPAGRPQPQQHAYSNEQGQPMPGHQPYQSRMSYESVASMKAQEAGYEISPTQDGDRERRKSSGIFKGIGDRFNRAASRERQSSISGQGPEQPNWQNGSNYQAQESQEPKKRRASFLPALRSRTSTDGLASNRPDSPAMSQTQGSQGGEGSIMSKSEKKKSFLGAAAGKMSAAQQKFIPSAVSRSSTTSLVNSETASTGTGANDDSSMGPPKKRFSGLAQKASTFTSRFRHSHDSHSSGIPQDPAEGQSPLEAPQAPGHNIGTSGSNSSFVVPPPPPKTRDRSASAGSFGMTPPPAPGSDQERRGRRGSFTGMISNIVGGRSSSRTRQSDEQQLQMQGFQGPQRTGTPSAGVPQSPSQREINQSPPGEYGRTPSLDINQRASRHLSGGSIQPPRPSPLAQETSATAGQTPVQSLPSRPVYSTAPPSEQQASASPTRGPIQGRTSPMPTALRRDLTQSPGPPATPGTERAQTPKSPIASQVTSDPRETAHTEEHGSEPQMRTAPTSEEAEETEAENAEKPSKAEPPMSPVKRQPTPHTSALLSSKTAEDEPRPPVPNVPAQSPSTVQATGQPPRGPSPTGPSDHERPGSVTSQTTQKPLSPASVRASGEGSPAGQSQQEVPSPGRSHENQQAPQQGPAPLNGPEVGRGYSQPPGPPPQGSGAGRGYSQPPGPPPQGPEAGRGYYQPPGPPPQGRAPNGQFPPQQPYGPARHQGFNQQGVAAQSQPQVQSQAQTPAQQEGEEPRWKGWKNRVSSQMAQITAQSGQGKQERDDKAQKESWKNRISSQVAQIAPHSSQEKPEKPEGDKPMKESWRDRVSGQIAQIAPQSGPEKPDKGDKSSTGDKLLGAFKRGPKPSEPAAPPAPPKQGQQAVPGQPGQQWRPSPAQQRPHAMPPQGMPPQQYAVHPVYGQFAYQGQVIPPNMTPAQYQHYQQQQYQQAQWAAADGRPGPPQQQWSYGQQMAAHQSQQHMQRPPEPQYGTVPIPRSYNVVHGEGSTAPTNYNLGRPMGPQQGQSYTGQQSYAQQQAYYQQGQPQAGQPPQVSSPPVAGGTSQQTQQAQQTPPGRPSSATPGEQGGFNLPIQGNVTPKDDIQQSPLPMQRPPNARQPSMVSDAGYSVESGALGGTGQRVLPPGQPQHGNLQTQPSTTSMNGQDTSRGNNQVSSSTEVTQGKRQESSRPASLSTDAALEGKDETKDKGLTVDVDKTKQDMDDIYDATPRLKQDRTGESKGVSDVSNSNDSAGAEEAVKSPVKEKEKESTAHVELEDTADARMRTMRLDSQEEKIFYDPEGDIPKMSATSYPGQEWNPYGEPEFAALRDD